MTFALTSDVKKDLPCELGGFGAPAVISRLTGKDEHCGNVLYFSTLEGDIMLSIYAASSLLMIIFNNYMGCKMSGDDSVKELRVAKKETEKVKSELKAAELAVTKAEAKEASADELGPLRDEATRCAKAVEEQKQVVKKLIGMEDEEEFEPMKSAEQANKTATLGEVGEAKGDDEEPFAIDAKGLDGKGLEL